MSTIILFNKPYLVLCQFSANDGKRCLKDYISDTAYKNFYPAGRLDHDSEGLVVLTDDGRLQNRIAHPQFKLKKTYWVQVEGTPTPSQLSDLRSGVTLKDGLTLPASVQVIAPPAVPQRDPPIRSRAHIPTAWLELTIQEGRNRQVRRMTAAVGLPTLRLIRQSIGPWAIDNLLPGQYRATQVNLPASQVAKPGRPIHYRSRQ